MTDPLEDRLRQAMQGVARGLDGPGAQTKQDLVAGLALRRHRQRTRTIGGLGVLSVLAVVGSLTLPALVDQRPPAGGSAAAGAAAPAAPAAPAAAAGGSAAGAAGAGAGAAGAGAGAAPGPAAGAGAAAAHPPAAMGPNRAFGSTQAGSAVSSPPVSLTGSDNGRTVTLRVGQTLSVNLAGSPGDRWTRPSSTDPAVVARSGGSVDSSTGGAKATFDAVAPGHTTLRATQVPDCAADQKACAAGSRSWSVTIRVTSRA